MYNMGKTAKLIIYHIRSIQAKVKYSVLVLHILNELHKIKRQNLK